MTIVSPDELDFSGIGLHPPGSPMDCGFTGAEQFLQTTICPLFWNPTGPQILQAS